MDFEAQYDEFSERMKTSYPKMYGGKYGGFAIGKGWWPIVEALSRQIQSHIDWANEQKEKYGRGEGCEQVVVVQVKEKFGGLRFYYNGGNDMIDGMVRMAESWAAYSCEECGAPGKRTGDGWIRTLCEFHIAEREALKKENYSEV